MLRPTQRLPHRGSTVPRGLRERAVDRARGYGFQVGLAEACVKALRWAAANNKLLDLYQSGASGASIQVNRYTDRARLSTGPYRPTGSPQEMWRGGELTPSLAFDAGFVRSFLEKRKSTLRIDERSRAQA